MTASEFARKLGRPYSTVARWLNDGLVPGAILQEFGSVRFWMIPVDVLRDFELPKIGRPRKVESEAAKKAAKKGARAK